jgi:glycosyltransferase involved in cell wall biosynthesis
VGTARRVVLDVQALQSRDHRQRGIARYTGEHAAALLAADPDLIDRLLLNRRHLITPEAERFVPSGRLDWVRRDLAYGPDWIHHVMSPFESGASLDDLVPRAVRRAACRIAVTLYDLIPLLMPDRYLAEARTRTWYHGRLTLVRSADLVFAISESSAADAVRHLGVPASRVHVIGAGVSREFRPPRRSLDERMAELRPVLPDLKPGFVLYPAGVDPRKNLDGLLSAHARLDPVLRRRHQLVITCRVTASDRTALHERAGSLGIDLGDLLLTGYVSDEVLRLLYQSAHLVVFPSHYEGFGLPIAEAIECGAPVIGSDVSSIPEVVPAAEALFDPADPDSIASALGRALSDPGFRETLQRASRDARGRHTWKDTAERTLEGYRACAPRRRGAARPPRLALVTPYPPDRTAIARYSAELAEALARTHRVDCFVEGDPSARHRPRSDRVRVLPVSALEAQVTAARYAGVIHCMGNNPLHRFVLAALRRVGGTVLCHDARMVGLYAHGPEADRYHQRVASVYDGRLDGLQRIPDAHEAPDQGIWMTREVLEAADLVLAHSAFAAEILRLEAGLFGVTVPVRQVPFAFPAMDEAKRDPRVRGGPVIATFGWVDPIKRPEALIDALPLVRDRVPGTVLDIVGPVQPDYAAELRRRAARLGVGGALSVTGAISDAEYRSRLLSTDVCVQLRARTQGESSLAIAEAMSAGLPTVVTDAGWMGELPGDAVVKMEPACAAEDLAHEISRAVLQPQTSEALKESAAGHARSHSIEAAAGAIVAALDGHPPTRRLLTR